MSSTNKTESPIRSLMRSNPNKLSILRYIELMFYKMGYPLELSTGEIKNKFLSEKLSTIQINKLITKIGTKAREDRIQRNLKLFDCLYDQDAQLYAIIKYSKAQIKKVISRGFWEYTGIVNNNPVFVNTNNVILNYKSPKQKINIQIDFGKFQTIPTGSTYSPIDVHPFYNNIKSTADCIFPFVRLTFPPCFGNLYSSLRTLRNIDSLMTTLSFWLSSYSRLNGPIEIIEYFNSNSVVHIPPQPSYKDYIKRISKLKVDNLPHISVNKPTYIKSRIKTTGKGIVSL